MSDTLHQNDLMRRAQTLAPTATRVLEVFAVAGRPLRPFELEGLAKCNLPKGTSQTWVEQATSDLLTAQLLVACKDGHECHPDLPEDLALILFGSTSCVKLVRLLRRIEPTPPWWQKSTSEQLFRQFRWSLLSKDRNLADFQKRCSELGISAFGRMGARVAREETFLRLPAELGLEMVQEALFASINAPSGADAAFRALKVLAVDEQVHDWYRALLSHQLAMRGEVDELEQLLTRYSMPVMDRYRRILSGDLTAVRALNGSSSGMLTVDFVYGVGTLARGEAHEPSRHGRAKPIDALLSWLGPGRAGRALAGSPVAELIQGLLDHPEAEAFYRPHLMLTLYWAGYRDELQALAPADWAGRYQDAGYTTFASWLRRIAGQSEGDSPYDKFVDLLQPVERWRNALRKLETWVEEVPQAAVVADERRLVWEIDPFGWSPSVEPKLQKMSKKGAWSVGQAKRLEELWQDPGAYSDDHDQKVFRAVTEVKVRQRGFHTYPDPMWEEALLALVGHPRVRLKQGHGEFVEVSLGEPSVLVREDSGSYHLSLVPALRERPGIVAVQEAPRRLVLYRVSKRLATLSTVVGRGLEIPLSEKGALKTLLSRMTGPELAVVSDLAPASGRHRQVESDPTLRIRLAPARAGVAVQLRVAPLGDSGPLLVPGEGNAVVLARDPNGEPVQTRRNIAEESERLLALRAHAPALLGTDFEVASAEATLGLLEELHELPPEVSLEWPEGRRFELKSRISALSWQRLKARADWFELDGEVRVSEDLVLSLSELLALKRRSAGRFVQLDDGTYLALTRELHRYLGRLSRLATAAEESGLKLGRLTALAALEGRSDVEVDDVWNRLKAKAEGAGEKSYRRPRSFRGDLRPYQLEGYRWLRRLADWGVGACLADDMGLGKTIQILALLASRAEMGPALVVAPTSVGWNWREEAARFAPDLKVSLLAESDRRGLVDRVGPGDVVVASYGLLVREVEALSGVTWASVVLDEAQAIKNSETKRAKAALAIPASFRVAATGTPVENHLEELWSLFRWLNPGLLGSQRWFGATFPAYDAEAQEDLSRLIRPFVLRRTKDQVLRELPARTDVVLRIDLSEAEMALYESMRREAVERFAGNPEEYIGVLAELTRLRRVCCHPGLVVPEWRLPSSKLEHFRTLTDELMENGHRALVFSQFVTHLKILAEDLDERGVAYQYLDGATPAAARRAAVEAFQGGSDPLFLISLKAGGTGLNLTAADYVLHMDPWWNPAVEDQASDRAHRLGQLRPVTVYRLVARGTVEERIVALHEEKRDLAERLLQGADSAAKLSTRELLALM